jgi:glycosyltransferase involved in cell wall biosynthesis
MLMPAALALSRTRKLLALKLVEHRNLQAARAIVVASDAEAVAVRDLDVNLSIHVVPNPLDPSAEEFFAKGRTARRDERERVVLCVSRLHPIKRIEYLINAFADLADDFPRWRLDIVGPPSDRSYERALAQLVEGRAMTRRIALLGGRTGDSLWGSYAAADLFALPSQSENFGRVVVEALAAGTPVIATTGSPWRLLESRGCGWWVVPSTSAIRQALMAGMRKSDDQRIEMGLRGMELARERFLGPAVAWQLDELYASLC